jgi:hypothetical protein
MIKELFFKIWNFFLKKSTQFSFFCLYCTTTDGKIINCIKKRRNLKMLMSPVEFFRNVPKKECPECGQHMEEQAESYLMECDRCLAKKEE